VPLARAEAKLRAGFMPKPASADSKVKKTAISAPANTPVQRCSCGWLAV
jgi:hypothetical protein